MVSVPMVWLPPLKPGPLRDSGASEALMLNLVTLLPMGMLFIPMDTLLQLTGSASSTLQDTPSSMWPVGSVVLLLTLMLTTDMGMDIPMLTVPMVMDTDMDVDTTGVKSKV